MPGSGDSQRNWGNIRAEKRQNYVNNSAFPATTTSEASNNDSSIETKLETEDDKYTFSMESMKNRLAFGAVIGSVTGASFGVVDAVKGIAEGSAFGHKLSTNRAKYTFGATMVAQSGLLFGCWYSTYFSCKYGIELLRKQDDFGNALGGGIIATIPLAVIPSLRRHITYGVLLIGMDVISNEMNR